MIRVVDGPLANVRGQRPEDVGYHGAAAALQDVWIALRANEREILELVTLEDVVSGDMPERVRDLVADPRAWVRSPGLIGRSDRPPRRPSPWCCSYLSDRSTGNLHRSGR